MIFADLQNQVVELYSEGAFAEALALVEREAHRFPERREALAYFRLCLTARTGDRDGAIGVLGDALDQGLSFSESVLREDEDLAVLQGSPAFEELVARSGAAYALRLSETEPTLLVVEPAPAKEEPAKLLFALHGNNSRAEDAREHWAPAADHGWLVALPQSAEPGFDGRVWNDREHARSQLTAQLEELRSRHAFDPDQVVLAGFSRGAELAMWLALTGELPARGFIAVAPSPNPLDFYTDAIARGRERGVRGFILVGARDTAFRDRGLALGNHLRDQGLACSLAEIPDVGHACPSHFARDHLCRALAYVLGSG